MFKLFMSGDNDLINTSLIQSKDDIIGLNDMKNIMIFHINKLNLNWKHEKQIFFKIYRKIRTNSVLTWKYRKIMNLIIWINLSFIIIEKFILYLIYIKSFFLSSISLLFEILSILAILFLFQLILSHPYFF